MRGMCRGQVKVNEIVSRWMKLDEGLRDDAR